ncbi:isoprenylcysteine carboxylmethyltransferase family protein [uncultured Maribacter sp.]|uniref:methyltransferase family protein n=1 Tax=uncultured Maribacter sp. TaxID=431308 RepID=UPI00262C7034|nr:isoprenylcysteine carboxylmethyltransferase family protein [uncultured Maribacter sp.]
MKLKIPPVVVLFVFGLLMYLLAKFLPFGYFHFFGRMYMVYFLFTIAFLIGLFAIIQFFVNKTTIDPRNPDKVSSLVVSGLYRYSRNPMYLALLLILFGWCIILGNAFNYILAVIFVRYMNRFQIFPEERALRKKFGKEYALYCSRVRRWF